MMVDQHRQAGFSLPELMIASLSSLGLLRSVLALTAATYNMKR